MDPKVQKELRLLKGYALVSIVLFAVLIFVAAKGTTEPAKSATFDTVTVHRINVLDREGKRAMIIADHDDMPSSIWNGKAMRRMGQSGSAIIFYNRLGDEIGGLAWNGEIHPGGSYDSMDVLSFDTITTDQLMQVRDGNDNGKTYSYMIGWNRPNMRTPEALAVLNQLYQAETKGNESKVRAIRAQHPQFHSATRYVFGYDKTNTAQVMLADAKGRPRIRMFVTPDGRAELEFLDASGKVTAEFPPAKR